MMRHVMALCAVFALATGCGKGGSDAGESRQQAVTGAGQDRAFLWSAPILAVSDLGETLRFYEEVLGFTSAWRWEDGDEYGGIARGGAWLSFNRDPQVAAGAAGQMVWFTVTGVDALHAEHNAAGADIVMPLGDQPWGFREYRVRDNNGYVLRIAEPIPCEGHARCLRTSTR